MGQPTALDLFHQADADLRALDSQLTEFRKQHFLVLNGNVFMGGQTATEGAGVRRQYDEMVRQKARLGARRSEALAAWSATRDTPKGENYRGQDAT